MIKRRVSTGIDSLGTIFFKGNLRVEELLGVLLSAGEFTFVLQMKATKLTSRHDPTGFQPRGASVCLPDIASTSSADQVAIFCRERLLSKPAARL